MDLSGQRRSDNVQDIRGGGRKLAVGGGIVGLLIVLVAAYFGVDPRVAQQLAGGVNQGGGAETGRGVNDGYADFSARVLGSTEDVWADQFQRQLGKRYKAPGMTLFSDRVDSKGCGVAPAAVGPFYCPVSQTVFLDPTFFDELEQQLGGSKAEFSQAYVVAHEVGHHVQHLLGFGALVEEFEPREGKNAGIRLELQADYLAGVWAHHARGKLKISAEDVREAIKTAKAIGDNRIQKRAQGWVSPESFTHGTDEQRTRFFLRGFETGDASMSTLRRLFFDPKKRPLDL